MTYAEVQLALQRVLCDLHAQFSDKHLLKQLNKSADHMQEVVAQLFDQVPNS